MRLQNNFRVEFIVVDEGGKRMDPAPTGVSVGSVCLKGWQVDRVDAPAGMVDGYDAHLIKINYDLEVEPDTPGLAWFEIAFDFVSLDLGSASPAPGASTVVIDALPRSGTFAEIPMPYVLNRYLNFVPGEDGAPAHVLLPSSTDRSDAFGIGSQRLRWRHVSDSATGLRPGSYAAWAVLLVPAGQVEQSVEFSARFDTRTAPDGTRLATRSPAAFRLTLAAPAQAPEVVTPSLSAEVPSNDEEFHVSAFICYAHDTQRHKNAARKFCNLLIANGVDAHIDQHHEDHRKPWDEWSHVFINQDDFVIVLGSPNCKMAFDGGLKDTESRGIRSEAKLIKEKLHTQRDEWTRKVLPVVLPHELVENVPDTLQPWTTDHYRVSELTAAGIDGLLRAMTGVARHARPPLGKFPPYSFKPVDDPDA